jgi:hypothetical protein
MPLWTSVNKPRNVIRSNVRSDYSCEIDAHIIRHGRWSSAAGCMKQALDQAEGPVDRSLQRFSHLRKDLLREIGGRPGIDIFHEACALGSKHIAHLHDMLMPGDTYRENVPTRACLAQIDIEAVIKEGEKVPDRLRESSRLLRIRVNCPHEMPTRHERDVFRVEACHPQRLHSSYCGLEIIERTVDVLRRVRSHWQCLPRLTVHMKQRRPKCDTSVTKSSCLVMAS